MSRVRNGRIGRNDPCHCGSGRKFKRCHGAEPPIPVKRGPLAPELQRALAHRHAEELRRQQQQGLGKPLVSAQFKGYQLVGIGKNRIAYGKWKTFFEFLDRYLKDTLTSEWGNPELKKRLAERHPVLQWYDAVCRYQQKTIKEPGKVHSAPMTGATAAYFGLAYNLFLLEQNAELQKRLLKRLRHRDQFHGAYYETFVAALCIRAGFVLELEDEGDGSSDHCEFSAKSSITGKTFSVEAKSRAPHKPHLAVGNQLYDALTKDAPHPRIVFIDVNVPDDKMDPTGKWAGGLADAVKAKEATMTVKGQPAPPAFVIITNHPYHYDLEATGTNRAALAVGFKIDDFGAGASFTSLIEAFKAMQKHTDLFRLVYSMRNYHIPTTFDGEVPEFAFGEAKRRWIIGEQYDLAEHEPGLVGMLTSGVVIEEDRAAHLAFDTPDGRNIVMRATLTTPELTAYKQHPETFFGVHQQVGRQVNDPLSLFEFFYDTYRHTPREKLLEFMKGAPDIEQLSKLPQLELALIFCDRSVAWAMRKRQPPKG